MIDKRPFLRYYFLSKPKRVWSLQSNSVEEIGYGPMTQLQQLLLELNCGSEFSQTPTLVGTHRIASVVQSKLSAKDISTTDLREILQHLQDILQLSSTVPPLDHIPSPFPRQKRIKKPPPSPSNSTFVIPQANQPNKSLVDTKKLRIDVLSQIPVIPKSSSDTSIFLLQQPVSLEPALHHRNVIHLFHDRASESIKGINWSTTTDAIKIGDIVNNKNKCDLKYQDGHKLIPSVFIEEPLYLGGNNNGNVLHCITNCVICDGTTLLNGKLRLDPDLKQAANLIEKGYATVDQFRFFIGLVDLTPEKLENMTERGLWIPLSVHPTEGIPTHVAHREVAKILWNYDGGELWKFLTGFLPNDIGGPLRQAASLLDAPHQCADVLNKHRLDVETQISAWKDT